MNRTELINSITDRLEGVDRKDVHAVLVGLVDTVTETVAEGEPVTIAGFAKFARKDVPAKKAQKGVINPFTQEKQDRPAKPATVKARITPLKAFKDAVAAAHKPRAKKPAKKAAKKRRAA